MTATPHTPTPIWTKFKRGTRPNASRAFVFNILKNGECFAENMSEREADEFLAIIAERDALVKALEEILRDTHDTNARAIASSAIADAQARNKMVP